MCRSTRWGLRIFGIVLVVGTVGLTAPATALSANPPSDWDLLPQDDLVRIELRHPLKVLDHPLLTAVWSEAGKSRFLQNLLAGPQFDRVRFVMQEIERASGLKWRRTLEKLTAKGLAASFTPGKEGSVSLIVSADSEKTVAEFVSKLRARLLSRVPEPQRSKILVRAVHRNQTYYRIGLPFTGIRPIIELVPLCTPSLGIVFCSRTGNNG
ncbi:MAG: hypothetical protein IID45_03810 [Planctomycetes bacterium]|nr:hypothetical protein [Planctomycetota bacterium]